jgi:hypothetical protein
MTDIFRNLEDVESGYAVFEKDQVLTPEQLNSLTTYLDDQGRLTRVALLGVGIACGLWPSLDGNEVTLGHGVGTTTDGDLVFVGDDVVYDRYKPYDKSAPKYKPFYRDGTMIPVFELVPEDKDDERARPLSRFGEEDRKLEAMVAVLLVESHLHDPDICTGTDCDNRGLNALHKTRLLLLDAKSAAALAVQLDTPDGAARTPLEPVVADRVALPAALGSEAELAALYRKTCASIHEDLVDALAALHKRCKSLFDELTAGDPATLWKKTLEKISGGVKDRGIQYYYDFLKDLADSYNALLDTLFGDTTVCCPDVEAFPKHLVLGALDPGLRSAGGRTGFYPSPMVSATAGQRAHARFLIRKLDTLIGSFELPAQAAEIRITPSAFEDRSLEQRAIPFYYAPRENFPPIHLAWSYALSKKGMERYSYSYHADRYDAAGGARKPFASQIGAFDFFRIEGHVGWKVLDAAQKLRDEVRRQNLPIDVETVLLGTQRRHVVFEPPIRHYDLLQFRNLMRADVMAQLDDAAEFGRKFGDQVGKAVAEKVITNADAGEGVEVAGLAKNKGNELAGHVEKARGKVGADSYDMDSLWQDDVAKAIEVAADLNVVMSPVTKKEFVTPIDTLIAGQPTRWLTWFDTIVKDAGEKEADRLLLTTYLAQHPGLEHYAGVLRGGTFVLVHDEAGTVVADFMLPYNCCERRGQAPQPPKLPPLPRPPFVFEKPVRIVPFPDKFRFEKFRDDFKKDVLEKDLEQYKISIYKDIVFSGAALKAGGMTAPGGGIGETPLPGKGGFGDTVLGMHVTDTTYKAQRVDAIRTQLLDPQLTESKRGTLEGQLKTAETELASAIVTTAEYIAVEKVDVKPGSEGAVAMSTASASLGKVSDIDALVQVEKGLTTISSKPTIEAEAKTVMERVLFVRGIR